MRDTALFRSVRLAVPDPERVREFYAGLLALPEREAERGFAVEAGATALEFFADGSRERPGEPGSHHIALRIPENRLAETVEWLSARLELVRRADGETIFPFPAWDAHSVYAIDPAGNVVEWIARHAVSDASRTPIENCRPLEVAEVGVVVSHVPALAAALRAGLALPAYGETSDTFAAIGDERGLFIFAREGRPWFATDIPARARRVEAVIAGTGTMRRFAPAGSSLQVDVR